jgi:hypothetical protein
MSGKSWDPPKVIELPRVIIGEGPVAGKPVSAICVGQANDHLPGWGITMRWREKKDSFVLETLAGNVWIEVPLVRDSMPQEETGNV